MVKFGYTVYTLIGNSISRSRSTMVSLKNQLIQVEPGKPGVEVSNGKKTMSQRKTLPVERAQGDQPVQRPNGGLCVHQSSTVPSGGGVFVVAGEKSRGWGGEGR